MRILRIAVSDKFASIHRRVSGAGMGAWAHNTLFGFRTNSPGVIGGRLGGAGVDAAAHNTRIGVSDKFAGAGHGGDTLAWAGWRGTDDGRRLGPALVKERPERSRNMPRNEEKSLLGGGADRTHGAGRCFRRRRHTYLQT